MRLNIFVWMILLGAATQVCSASMIVVNYQDRNPGDIAVSSGGLVGGGTSAQATGPVSAASLVFSGCSYLKTATSLNDYAPANSFDMNAPVNLTNSAEPNAVVVNAKPVGYTL